MKKALLTVTAVLCLALVLTAGLWNETALAAEENGFTQDHYEVLVGKKITLKVNKTGIKGKVTYTFSSSDTNVATISAKGTVKGIAPGTAVITGTATAGGKEVFTMQAEVTVNMPVSKIQSDVKTLHLAPGVSWQPEITVSPESATSKEIVWKTSKKSVATVSEDGVITAVKPGKCKITGTAADGSGKKVVITVQVKNYKVIITGTDGADVTYKTPKKEFTVTGKTKNECVKVDAGTDGKVHLTPVKAGEDHVTITVKRANSRKTEKTTYSVFVTPAAIAVPAEEVPEEEQQEETPAEETTVPAEETPAPETVPEKEETPVGTEEETPV